MRRFITLGVVAAVVLLGACRTKQAETGRQVKPAPWKMALQTTPDPPHMNKDVTFRLTMADEQGKPVTGARVEAALVMSTMDMGKNEFKFAEKAPGVYEGTGKMDMAGPWEVVVTAKVPGEEGQKRFELGVRE